MTRERRPCGPAIGVVFFVVLSSCQSSLFAQRVRAPWDDLETVSGGGGRPVDGAGRAPARLAEYGRVSAPASLGFELARNEDAATAANPSQGLEARVDTRGVRLSPIQVPVRRPGWSLWLEWSAANLSVDDGAVSLQRDELDTTWTNRWSGFEQRIEVRATDRSDLVEMKIGGELSARPSSDGRSVRFADSSGVTVLVAKIVSAVDARGRDVDVELVPHLDRWSLRLFPDVAGAAETPVTVTTRFASRLWELRGVDGDPEQPAMAAAGDVNADGFGDALVSLSRADGVSLFLGTANGLAERPAWTFVAGPEDDVQAIGWTLAAVGDVDDDGHDDVVVGASGIVYVFAGTDEGLTREPVVTQEPERTSIGFGRALAGIGDIDGDGYSDFVVGAPGFGDSGAVFVYLGSPRGVSFVPDWRIDGPGTGSEFGAALSSCGDVDGDGYCDILVGAPRHSGEEEREGAAFLFLGSARGPSLEPDWGIESDEPGAALGSSVAIAGDLNGDGFADIVVGAPLVDSGGVDRGRVQVFHGSSRGPAAHCDWRSDGARDNGRRGEVVAPAGDRDGDGFADVLIIDGERSASVFPGSRSGPGRRASQSDDAIDFAIAAAPVGDVDGDGFGDLLATLRVDSGLHGAVRVALLSGEGRAVSPDRDEFQRTLERVEAEADINGDGFLDRIVGFAGKDAGAVGSVELYFGSTDGFSTVADWRHQDDQPGSRFGSALATGDVNGDGFFDLIVGAPLRSTAHPEAGRARLFLGSAWGFRTPTSDVRDSIELVMGLGDVPEPDAWTCSGDADGVRLSSTVACVGDVDGDGFGDVAIGAPSDDRGGEVLLFLGSGQGLAREPVWRQAGGGAVSAAGDVNRDGFADVFVDATELGRSSRSLYLGSATGLARVAARTVPAAEDGLIAKDRSRPSRVELVDSELRGNVFSPAGRSTVALEWSARSRRRGQPRISSAARTAFVDSGIPSFNDSSAVELAVTLSGLSRRAFDQVRARFVSRHPLFPRQPWTDLEGALDNLRAPRGAEGGGAGLPPLRMYVTDNLGQGLSFVDTQSAQAIPVGPFGQRQTFAAAFDVDGVLFTIVETSSPARQLATLDLGTGAATLVGAPLGIDEVVVALEISLDGPIYGADWEGNFYEIDAASGQPSLIGNFGGEEFLDVMDLAFDLSGTLWATGRNTLWTIDTATGGATFATEISGVAQGTIMGIAFDDHDTLFATAYVDGSPLYSIDVANGSAASLGATDLFFSHGADIYLGHPPVAVCQDVELTFEEKPPPFAEEGEEGGASICEIDPDPTLFDGGSTDADGDVLTFSIDPPGPFRAGVYSVTLTVTDERNLTDTCDATLTVIDPLAPESICPSDPVVVAVDDECSPVLPDVIPLVEFFDNCSAPEDVVVWQDPPEGELVTVGQYIVTVFAQDEAGNVGSCEVIVDVIDDIRPVFEFCPEDLTIFADDGCPVPIPDLISQAIITDNCTPTEELETMQFPPPGAEGVLGSNLVVCSAIDAQGNQEVCQTVVEIVDRTAPVVTCPDPISAVLEVLVCTGAEPQSKTYTLDADFDEGSFFNADHAAPNNDQLQLASGGEVTTFPVLWIANAGEDSVSRWNTSSNQEVGRYHTWFGPLGNHTAFSGPAPSRTAVDFEGDCFVLNRHFDGRSPTVLKILIDSFIDRNGNSVENTSSDTSGNGFIEPSEMFPFADTNGDGIIQQSEITDERVAWATHVGPPGGLGRSLAIDGDGNIWVGLYNRTELYKVRGSDGVVVGGPFNSGRSNYGAAVDGNGILWGATLANDLIEFDTNTNTLVAIHNHAVFGGNYGITLGQNAAGDTIVYLGTLGLRTFLRFDSGTGTFSAPAVGPQYSSLGISTDAAGNIYSGVRSGSAGPGLDQGSLVKYAPDGSRLWTSPSQVIGDNRGVPVDSSNNVWFVHLDNSRLSKFRGSDGAHLGSFPTGRLPYTYSDATGLGLRTSFPQGTWTVTHECGVPDVIWTDISWNTESEGFEPAGTSITVEARTADTEAGLGARPFVAVTNAANPGLAGQFIEFRVTLTPSSDGIGPVLSDLSVSGRSCSASAGESCSAVVPSLGATATDNCTPAEEIKIVQDPPAGAFIGLGETVITVTATDSSGNSSQCSTSFTVEDTTAPIVICPDVTEANAGEGCLGSVPDVTGGVIVDDNCSDAANIAVTQDPPVGSVIAFGEHSITVFATDEAGNTGECLATIDVIDRTPPIVTCPPETTLLIEGNCFAFIPDLLEGVAFEDNCDEPGALQLTQDPPAGSTVGSGVHVVVITAKDEAGNSGLCEALVTVRDVVPPTIECPLERTLGTNEGCGYAGPFGDPIVADNCTAPEDIVVTNDAPEVLPLGISLVTWTAQDADGNTATCSHEVTILDKTAPEITILGANPLVVECGSEYVDPGAQAIDNCEGDLTKLMITTILVDTSEPGVYQVVYESGDSNGFSSEELREVQVVDTTPPQIQCPQNRDVECTGTWTVVEFEPTVTDRCDESPVTECVPPSGSQFPIGTTTVVCSAVDAEGNLSRCQFDVTVICVGGRQIPGDSNQDGAVDVADAVQLLRYFFRGGSVAPACGDGSFKDEWNLRLLDWDGDGVLDVSDLVAQLNFLYVGGPSHHLGTECFPISGCADVCGAGAEGQ